MNGTLRRKGTIGTIGDAIGWLRQNPILIGVFFLYGLFGIALELLGSVGDMPSYAGAVVLLSLNGLVHVLGAQQAAAEPPDLRQASATVIHCLPSLFGATVVYLLFVSLGLVLFVLPGIYLAVRLSLAFPACVIDDRRTDASLYRSWDVARGNVAKLFGITLVSWLVTVGVGTPAVLASDLGQGPFLAVLIGFTALFAVVNPVAQFAYARVYLENRPMPDSWTADDVSRVDRAGDR